MDKERNIIYFDLLKILACFFVIVNHTVGGVFGNASPSVTWFLGLTYFFSCKVAVPIFLLVSGALLLGKSDTAKKSLIRIFKVVLVIIIFSAIYYLQSPSREVKTVADFFGLIYSNYITNAFWYLYLYLGIMITLPLLQKINRDLSKNMYMYIIGISVVFFGIQKIIVAFVPGIAYCSEMNLNYFNCSFGLLFCGYYVHNFFQYKKKYIIFSVATIIVGMAISIIGTYLVYLQQPDDYLIFDNRYFLTVTGPAIATFYLMRCFTEKVEIKHNKIISHIGRCTFGIFLVSDLVIGILVKEFFSLDAVNAMHPLLPVIILQIAVFLIGLLITSVLIKLPLLKKLL